jgi:predicted nucleic acid-binding protein
MRETVDQADQLLTSTICVTEVLAGRVHGSNDDVVAEREEFGGVRALDFNESLALQAARLHTDLLANGESMSMRDLMIATTARSTGDELVVADTDFQKEALEEHMDVRNLLDE